MAVQNAVFSLQVGSRFTISKSPLQKTTSVPLRLVAESCTNSSSNWNTPLRFRNQSKGNRDAKWYTSRRSNEREDLLRCGKSHTISMELFSPSSLSIAGMSQLFQAHNYAEHFQPFKATKECKAVAEIAPVPTSSLSLKNTPKRVLIERRNTRINNEQLTKMLSMLESAPDIARAIARGPQNIFWRRLAKELNNIGPPTKDPTSWKKVWFDYKCGVKKRVAQYNEDISEGVYPKPLSVLHKRTVKLLDMDVTKVKLLEDDDSSEQEDTNGTDTNHSKDAFDMDGDLMDSQNSTGVADETMEESNTYTVRSSSSFSNTINACQQRLASMPNITITKQKNGNDQDDPLMFCPSGKRPRNPYGRATKRKREECFEIALETNRALVESLKTSVNVQKEMVTEMRALRSALEEFTESLKQANGKQLDSAKEKQP
uniref:Myb_DNA-bind_5 domain-containing protein n=1 Tax=Anopheles epiroticus TaxID=199890 RepID=A0A182PIU3_9DIPT